MSLLDGLRAYYKFEETSGDLIDVHNDWDGTLIGGVTQGVTGKIGNAYHLDGVDDYIEIDKDVLPVGTDDFTISLWIYMDDADYHSFFTKQTSSNGMFWLGRRTDGDVILWFNDSLVIEVETISNIQTWEHYVLVKDGNTFKLYKDGNLIGTGTHSGGLEDAPVWLGRPLLGGGWTEGKLDEYGIWTRALTEEEILQLYNNGDGLTYPFGEEGTIVTPTTLSLTSELTGPFYGISSTYIPTILGLTSNVLSPSLSISTITTPSALTLDSELLSPIIKYTCTFLASSLSLSSNLLSPGIQIVGGEVLVYPSVLELTSELHTPSTIFGVLLTPSTLNLTSNLLNPTYSIDTSASPSALTLTSSLLSPAYSVSLTHTTSTLNVTSELISPTFSLGMSVSPSTLELTSNLLSPSLSIGASLSISTLSITSNLLSPSIQTIGATYVYPSTLTLTPNILSPSLSITSVLTPSTLTLTSELLSHTPFIPPIAPSVIASTLQLIANEIDYFGTNVTVRTITDSSYSDWGDAIESTSDKTKTAFVQTLSQEDELVKEGVFQSGDKIFWFRGDETSIERGNRIQHDRKWYEINEVIEHEAAGTVFVIEARTRKI